MKTKTEPTEETLELEYQESRLDQANSLYDERKYSACFGSSLETAYIEWDSLDPIVRWQ